MQCEFIDIRTTETKTKGFLSFFEGMKDIPFDIKRVYFIYQVPAGTVRGGHAHRDLVQLLFCPYGRIDVILDDGEERCTAVLDRPSKGLIVRDMVWRDMVWREDNSVLVVAASGYYDESDYIRDYNEFIAAVSDK